MVLSTVLMIGCDEDTTLMVGLFTALDYLFACSYSRRCCRICCTRRESSFDVAYRTAETRCVSIFSYLLFLMTSRQSASFLVSPRRVLAIISDDCIQWPTVTCPLIWWRKSRLSAPVVWICAKCNFHWCWPIQIDLVMNDSPFLINSVAWRKRLPIYDFNFSEP
jgi:hypothetical protein